MRRTEKLLFDLAQAAKEIEIYTQGMDRAAFEADAKTRAAVLYTIMIIGEAVKQLPEEWRSHHPTIPWQVIARMRDHVTHRYFDTDMDIVWDVVMRDAPNLYQYLAPLVTPLLKDEEV